MGYNHRYRPRWAATGLTLSQHTTPLKKGEPPGQGGPPSGDGLNQDVTRDYFQTNQSLQGYRIQGF